MQDICGYIAASAVGVLPARLTLREMNVMRYILALMIFAFTMNHAAAAQTSVSFKGMITEAVCHISTSHGDISSSCVKNSTHHTASFHVASGDNQMFTLPGNVGHMQVKWLNAARTKGLLVALYR
jgi:type 1 fimbria pilin